MQGHYAHDKVRTCDRRRIRPSLYQLSYMSMYCPIKYDSMSLSDINYVLSINIVFEIFRIILFSFSQTEPLPPIDWTTMSI